MRVVVLMPVFQDAAAAAIVISQLKRTLSQYSGLSIVVVDDGSNPPIACADLASPPSGSSAAGDGITIVSLRRNVGHQRAIAIGLAYVAEQLKPDMVLVMDGDGQDRVEDAGALIEACRQAGGGQIVFARRMRRVESLLFRLLYRAYRDLHWVLTGVPVQFGNFSVVPRQLLSRLVYSSELWNHYAAAVLKTRLPYTSIPTSRAPRLAGDSKMNFVSLVVHGLSALSVFSETIGVRLLVTSALGFGVLTFVAVAIVVLWQLGLVQLTSFAMITGALVISVALQIVTTCGLLALAALGRRSSVDFVPARDYGLFIESATSCTREPH